MTAQGDLKDLDKRVKNLESVVRKDFANLGGPPKLSLHEDKSSVGGGHISVNCSKCSHLIGSWYSNAAFSCDFCPKCGTKIDFKCKEFKEMKEKLEWNAKIYTETRPLKEQIEDLKKKKGGKR